MYIHIQVIPYTSPTTLEAGVHTERTYGNFAELVIPSPSPNSV